MRKEMDVTKPPPESHLYATALARVSEQEWRRVCCEQFAEQFRDYCCQISVGGCDSIDGAVPRQVSVTRYCEQTGAALDNQKEWSVQTQGTNLAEIMTWPGVDHTRTICNHAIEVQKVLGIEAARAVLLDEFRQVLSFNGAYVDYRHLALLCDTMTHGGQITPVSRHAFRKKATGPYTRAAFEQQTDVLRDAGIYGEYEDGNDMRSAIMMGKRIPQGTGSMFDTFMSLERIENTPSSTMREIDMHRKEQACREMERKALEHMPRNPFGSAVYQEEDSMSDNESCIAVPDESTGYLTGIGALKNPFSVNKSQTASSDYGQADEPAQLVEKSQFCYRPQSPSMLDCTE